MVDFRKEAITECNVCHFVNPMLAQSFLDLSFDSSLVAKIQEKLIMNFKYIIEIKSSLVLTLNFPLF